MSSFSRAFLTLLTVTVATAVVFVACDWKSDSTTGTFSVDTQVLADGATPVSANGVGGADAKGQGGAGTGGGGGAGGSGGRGSHGIDASALHVVARVTLQGPEGNWSAVVTADGAFSLAQTIGSTSSNDFALSEASKSAVVDIPLRITQPGGVGFVHVEVGPTRQTFAFDVASVFPQLELCVATVGGSCQPAPSFGGAGGVGGGVAGAGGVGQVTLTTDGKTEIISLHGGSLDSLHDGDRFTIKVWLPPEIGPSQEGATWSGTLSMGGIFKLDPPSSASDTPLQFSKDQKTISVGGMVSGVGVGRVSASVGVSAPWTVESVASSALQGVAQVRFLRYTGFGADNLVSICSTHRGGTIHVSVAGSQGTISPEMAPLTVASDSICPDSYPGQADFVWNGDQEFVQLNLTDDATKTTTLSVVPSIGTATQVTIEAAGTSTWVCEAPPDAGVGGSPGNTGSNLADAGEAGVAEGGAGADTAGGGTSGWTPPCPGAATVFVPVQVKRDEIKKADLTPRGGITLDVRAPKNAVVTTGSVTTDANGMATIQLSVQQQLNGPLSIVVSAGELASKTITVK